MDFGHYSAAPLRSDTYIHEGLYVFVSFVLNLARKKAGWENATCNRACIHIFFVFQPQAHEPGDWGLQPPDSGKPIIFRAKAKFIGQKPAAKMRKKLYLLNENKTEFILSSEIKCPKSGIYWVG